jgi:hypothetical protein
MTTIRRISASSLPLTLALAFTLASATSVVAQESERFTLRGDAPAVFNLAGDVEIVAGDGPGVVVEVTRGGDDAGRLQIRTGEIDGRETLRMIYPDDEIGYPRMGGGQTSLRVRDDGTFGDGFGGGDRVTVERDGDVEAWADLRIEVPAGTRLAVHLGVGEMDVRDVDGDLTLDGSSGAIRTRGTRGTLSLDTGSGSIEVSDARGDLTADTGSGDITLRNVDGGELSLDTGSGSVELSSVRAASLLVDTGSGSIRGSGVEADGVEMDTGSGSIRLEGMATSRATLDTGSGSVRLDLLSDVDELIIDTGSGGVLVTVPADLGARLDLDSGSGGVQVNLPVTDLRSDRSSLQGSVGDGDGLVEIDTGSGSIRLRQGS